MADFWKSQPRKFCEFCKCWTADNKASREFHERGKRHQENVKNKLDELRKKSVAEEKKTKETASYLARMEKAAMKKLREDLTHDPTLASQYGVTIKNKKEELPITVSKVSSAVVEESSTEISETSEVWCEAYSPEGYVYYWNSITQESRWELPPELSTLDAPSVDPPSTSIVNKDIPSTTEADQSGIPKTSTSIKDISSGEINIKNNEKKESSATVTAGDESCPETKKPKIKAFQPKTSIVQIGPKKTDDSVLRKSKELSLERVGASDTHRTNNTKVRSAYGAWQEIKSQDEQVIDYELPTDRTEQLLAEEKFVAPPEEKKKLKFTEKTVTSLGQATNEPIEGFKKRKLNSGVQRSKNIRRDYCDNEDS